jgi:ribosomal protein S6--L-glutamate ligase
MHVGPGAALRVAERVVAAPGPSSDDAVAALARATGSPASAVGVGAQRAHGLAPLEGAERGALEIRVLSPEDDADGARIVAALRARGATAGLWDLDHLRADPATRQLTYRGEPVAAPDLAIGYQARIPDGGLGTMRAMERDLGIPFVNGPEAIARSNDKAVTYERFRASGVPTPETHVVERPEDVRAAVEAVTDEGRPTWFKLPSGTQGIGVSRVSDPREAVAVGEMVVARPGERLLVQRQIEVPEGQPLHDTRAFVVGDRVIAAMHRVQPHGSTEFRTNLHNQDPAARAAGVPAELDEPERATALAAREALGLDVAGVDLMGGMAIEGNWGPGHAIAKVTGVPVADAIADLSIERARAAAAR